MLRLAFIALAASLWTAPSRAETLNLLNWERYIDQGILEAWTAKTGVFVRQTYYDSGDARDEILADPQSNVDLVVISDNGAGLYGRRGILGEFGAPEFTTLDEYPADLRARCGSYGVPYFTGTMGILYRSDKVVAAPTSWTDLMAPAAAMKGHVAMYDDPTEMFVAPLMALGKSINTFDTETMKAAFSLLKSQAPSVLTYGYVMTSSQNQDYGDKIFMALGYSGDQFALNEIPNSPGTWRFALPQEGSLYWLDCVSVVAASPRKALALDLLNHITASRNALANAIALKRPTPNLVAYPQVPAEMRASEAIYPPSELIERSQAPAELTPDAVQTRRRIISTLVNFSDAR